jgi:hypothetical protein
MKGKSNCKRVRVRICLHIAGSSKRSSMGFLLSQCDELESLGVRISDLDMVARPSNL